MTTPDTPAHTPLPWVINPAYPTYISSADATADICELDGWPVDCVAEENANRDFIVRACNSHYQLVEALRGIIDHFDCSHGNAPGHDHLIPGVWDKDVSNGAKGGTKCGWCEQWKDMRATLAALKDRTHG